MSTEPIKETLRRKSSLKWEPIVGGFAHDLTTEQKEILVKVKASIENEDYPEKDGVTGYFRLDDATILKFLRANNFNGYKATVMIKEHLAFRRKWRPHEISEKNKKVSEFLTSGFWTISGFTKNHHPFELIQAKKFIPSKFQGDDFIRSLIYIREKVQKMIIEQRGIQDEETTVGAEMDEFVLRERTLILIDAAEWTFFTQGSIQGMKQIKMITEMLLANWPETLGVAVIVNASAPVRWIFLMIKRWMDEDLAGRIHFASNFTELHELIDPSLLSPKYGGTLEEDTSIFGRPTSNSLKSNKRFTFTRKSAKSPGNSSSSDRKSIRKTESTASSASPPVEEKLKVTFDIVVDDGSNIEEKN